MRRTLDGINAASHALGARRPVLEVTGDVDAIGRGERPTVTTESEAPQHVDPRQIAVTLGEFVERLVAAPSPYFGPNLPIL